MTTLKFDKTPTPNEAISLDDISPEKVQDAWGWGHVIDAVRQLHAGLVNRFYVYGAAGSGKSHLLSAICDSYLEVGKTAIKVSLLELLDAPTEAITCLDQYDLVH